jgi:hypothetical protein
MHAIIMEMFKANPDERISSADVVSRLNNLIEFQLSIGLLFQPYYILFILYSSEGKVCLNVNLSYLTIDI